MNALNPNSTRTQTISYQLASFTSDTYTIDSSNTGILASPVLSVGNLSQLNFTKSPLTVGKLTNISLSFRTTNPLSPNSKVELLLPEGFAYQISTLECYLNSSLTSCNSTLATTPRGSYYSSITILLLCPSFCVSYTTFNLEIRGAINGFSTKTLNVQLQVSTVDDGYVDKGSFNYTETLTQNLITSGPISKSSNTVDQVVSTQLTYTSETPYLSNSKATLTIPLDILSLESGFPNCGSLTCTLQSQNSTHVVLNTTLDASSRTAISISVSPF